MSDPTSSSSGSRVRNIDVAMLNFEGLAIRPKQTQADSDKVGSNQDSTGAMGTMTLNSNEQNEEPLRGQSSTNISAGQPSTDQNSQEADDSRAQLKRMIDQILARVPTLDRRDLLYTVKLFAERPLAEVKDELLHHGITPDDSLLLEIGDLAIEHYRDIVEELQTIQDGPSWDVVVR